MNNKQEWDDLFNGEEDKTSSLPYSPTETPKEKIEVDDTLLNEATQQRLKETQDKVKEQSKIFLHHINVSSRKSFALFQAKCSQWPIQKMGLGVLGLLVVVGLGYGGYRWANSKPSHTAQAVVTKPVKPLPPPQPAVEAVKPAPVVVAPPVEPKPEPKAIPLPSPTPAPTPVAVKPSKPKASVSPTPQRKSEANEQWAKDNNDKLNNFFKE